MLRLCIEMMRRFHKFGEFFYAVKARKRNKCVETHQIDILGIETVEKNINPNRDQYC